jgi:hypothetical protein
MSEDPDTTPEDYPDSAENVEGQDDGEDNISPDLEENPEA